MYGIVLGDKKWVHDILKLVNTKKNLEDLHVEFFFNLIKNSCTSWKDLTSLCLIISYTTCDCYINEK